MNCSVFLVYENAFMCEFLTYDVQILVTNVVGLNSRLYSWNEVHVLIFNCNICSQFFFLIMVEIELRASHMLLCLLAQAIPCP
jgi:hypothetical protein